MMYTTVPAWLISAALMLWLLPNVAAHDMNSVEAFRAQLEATGLVHAYSLIPFALLVILALMRVNAIVAMLFTVVVALIVTYFHSTPDLKQLGAWFYSGYKLEGEAFKDIAPLDFARRFGKHVLYANHRDTRHELGRPVVQHWCDSVFVGGHSCVPDQCRTR